MLTFSKTEIEDYISELNREIAIRRKNTKIPEHRTATLKSLRNKLMDIKKTL